MFHFLSTRFGFIVKQTSLSADCLGAAGPGKGEASDEDDDNEFFDAMEEAPEFITVPADPQFHKSVLCGLHIIT